MPVGAPVTRRRALGLAGAAFCAAGASIGGWRRARAEAAAETVVYVANAGDPSLHVLTLNRATGELDLLDKPAVPGIEKSPGMALALSPDRRFLYAAPAGQPFALAAFAADPATGKLAHLGSTPLDGGTAYLTTDRSGKWLLAASDTAGRLAVYAIGPDGQVKAPASQVLDDRPKADCVLVDAANRYAYCTVPPRDAIQQLRFDAANGMLGADKAGETRTKPGAGPRRLAFHPSGRFLFVITEAAATIGSYAVDRAGGGLKPLQSVDMLDGRPKEQPVAGDLRVSPDGRYLYGSERSGSRLVGFRVDAAKGILTRIGHWPTETAPAAFAIEPRGRFLLSAGLESNHMTVYAIRPNGTLEPVKQHALGKMPSAVEIVDLK